MTALSALVLVAAFLLGIGASALKQRWNSYIDMTEEGLYTLTDAFLDEVSDITDEIVIDAPKPRAKDFNLTPEFLAYKKHILERL